jgi:hypothetical protein
LSDGAALYPISFVGSEMPSRHDAPAEWPTAVAAQQGKGIGGRVEAGVMFWAGIKLAGIQGRSKGEPGGIWVKWSPDQWTRERERAKAVAWSMAASWVSRPAGWPIGYVAGQAR